MKQNRLVTGWLAAVVGLGITATSQAADQGIQFKFPIGFSFVNGAYDVNSKLKSSFTENGYTVTDDFVWPIGLTFNPRVEFPFGLGLGAVVGPTEFMVVGKNHFGGSTSWSDTTELNYIIPVGGYAQFNFFKDRPVSPFIRAGVRYPITGGDNFSSGKAGPFGTVGVEFYRNKKVGFGVEAGYDASEVQVNANVGGANKKATPIGFNAGIFVLF
jgi:hypothetical protein